VLSYEMDESSFNPESLALAVKNAYQKPGLGAVRVDERREQRAWIATEHEQLYRRLLR
jgi:hypothetical protein